MATRLMWDPWQDMRRLQREVAQLFGDVNPGAQWPLTGQYPPINLTRDDAGITLEALCPGVDRETLDMTVVGDAVTIRGERKADPGVPEERYHRRERPLGAFTRTVSVAERLDPDHAKATYANGILTVRLARAPEATAKKIAIQN